MSPFDFPALNPLYEARGGGRFGSPGGIGVRGCPMIQKSWQGDFKYWGFRGISSQSLYRVAGSVT